MDNLACLHNVADELIGDKYPIFCRYPIDIREQLNPNAKNQAIMTAGVEIRLHIGTNGCNIVLWVASKIPQTVVVNLGEHFLWKFMVGPGEHHIPLKNEFSFPWLNGMDARDQLKLCPQPRFSPTLIRICFSHESQIGLMRIEGDYHAPNEEDVPFRKLLCYGSSITQGYSSLTYAGGYAPRLSQKLGCDLINFGSANSAHCEKAITDHMVSRKDWDFAIVEIGINMLGLDKDLLRSRVQYMVETLTRNGDHRRVFFMDMFRHFNDLPTWDGTKAQEIRSIVCQSIQEFGGPMGRYIPVQHIPSWNGLGADLLHPSDVGMEEMADYLASVIQSDMPADYWAK